MHKICQLHLFIDRVHFKTNLQKSRGFISMQLETINNYVYGQWLPGSDKFAQLLDASSGEEIGQTSTHGLSFKDALEYARKTGNPGLRKLTFHERGRCLKSLALHLLKHKEKYYQLSYCTGATKVDGWVDIEGGIGNLFVYASKGRREMPDLPYYIDGKTEGLSKGGSFVGQHICTPLAGCAVHINAFNFPVWGMLEKLAVNFLAGVPAIVKPATLTSYLTQAVVKDIIDSKILPEGSLQILCGSAGDLLEHVQSQDIVTFTGSASTGQMLKAHPQIMKESVRFNMEADSLNCSILGPDATPDTAEFKIFIKEVAKEMTIKAGQKCTAIRRAIVPENLMEDVSQALKERLGKTTIGDPRRDDVRMGPLASKDQLQEVQEKIEELSKYASLVMDGRSDFEVKGASRDNGFFMAPTLLVCERPFENDIVHSVEAFGPVSTLFPYKTTQEAIDLANKGGGSLVGSLVSADKNFSKDIVLGTANHHGRLLILNERCAKESTGHGSPMPQLVHGGPGRAGGGEEMGGIRGIHHYMQRTALQGDPTTLSYICERHLPGADRPESERHPFTKHFEEIKIGETLTTHKRTVTETDIVNFANLSWDHFYAHTDETSLEGTLFESRVAHGYFVISMAAGLFVHAAKGPVLANYGLDELRFTKPVYVGATLGVKLTAKEKIDQEDREDETPRGIVKWQVDVTDDEGENVALATILTLVAKKGE
jgi:oxepin-CoA hydrolase/3-oxo-5,6-dehydrosuberyl-CoA semialdehyde dehydrogenase